jgi:hypothetical protein
MLGNIQDVVGKPEEKRPLRIPRRIIIKWMLKKLGCGLAQDRDRWRAIMNTVKCEEFVEWARNHRVVRRGCVA